MKNLGKILASALLTMLSITANAQQIEASGTVVDTKGESVIGATVKEKGTLKGTITDFNGKFKIKVNRGAKLLVSYIGYESVTVTAGKDLQIQIKENADQLGEVVVIGYGTARKKDLTGSVIQVRPESIANENPQTVQDILRGTAGLSVGYNADAKGGGSLQIRGQRSVYTDGSHNSPLLILDGMMFYGELSEINPDDIEQIDILKDASSAAVYGAKAANGVILITTKKGKKGKPTINLTANIGFAQRSAYRNRFSVSGYLQHRQDWLEKNYYGVNPETGEYEAYQSGTYASKPGYYTNPNNLKDVSLEDWRAYSQNNDGESDMSIWARRLGFEGNALENFLNNKTVDWEDISFRTGLRQDYNASVSGASDNANYYISAGYLKNQGVLIDDEYHAFRSNIKVNANITKWLEIGTNINFQDRSDGSIDMDEDYQMRNSPFADYKDADGNLVQYPLSSEYSQRGYNYEFQKQYLKLEKGYTVLNTIFDAKVKLPFNVTYTFNVAPRYQYFYDRYFMSAELPGCDPTTRGANREQDKNFDWSLNNTITWDQTFAQKHHFTLTLVQEAEERRFWSDRIEARNILPSDALGFHNTQNGSKDNSSYSTTDTHQTADGLLARLQYVYNDKYLLTASIRRDGYSAFGSSNPYATFPSIAAAWTFTNEKFWKWQDIMDYGKIRLSYGKNGNRSLSDPYVALASLYEGAGKMMGYVNNSGELELYRYLMAERMANPNLQWEKTSSWNTGLDFSFLNGRIKGSIDFYKMQTKDMIMNKKIPSFTGFNSITTNLGQVNNDGIELTLNTTNIKNTDFEWTTSVNFSYNKNRIKHLYYENENIVDKEGNITGTKEMDDVTNGWFIGKPIGEIWDFKVIGIWQKDQVEEAKKYGQQPGDPIVWNNPDNDVYDAQGNLTKIVYDNNDKVYQGQTTPPINWSMRNEFVLWKDLTFSFNLYSYMGYKSLSTAYLNNDDDGGRMTYALANKEEKEYWTLDNPTNKYGRIEAAGPTGAKTPGRLYNRSFVRLENVTFGYTLPKIWTKKYYIDRIKVYGTIRNVATIHSADWVYGDPETGNMATREFTFGVNLTF
jgi:TonB-linked SusC/RagA family outer membrane protein